MVIWGSPPVVSRAVSADVPPLALALARWVIALVVLLPIVWRKLPRGMAEAQSALALSRRTRELHDGRQQPIRRCRLLHDRDQRRARQREPARDHGGAWPGSLRAAGCRGRQSFGIALAFLGILIMVFRADLGVLATLGINVGDLIMLGAVVGWSLYAVYLHHRDYVPSSEVLLFVIALTGCVILIPLFLVETALRGPFALSPQRGRRDDLPGAVPDAARDVLLESRGPLARTRTARRSSST